MNRRRSSLIAAGAALAIGVAIAVAPALLAVAVPLAIGAVILHLLVQGATSDEGDAAYSRLAGWVAFGFVAHLLVGWVGHVSNIAADSAFYDRVAEQIAQHWRHGYPFEALPSGKEGFFYMLAALYRVFGHYPASGVVLNCVLASATVPVTYDTTKRLFGSAASRFIGPLLLLPGFLVWTSPLLREAGVLLLIATTLNAAVRLSDGFGARRFILLGVSLPLLFTFRGNVALLMMGSLIPALALSRRQLVSGVGTGLTVTAFVLVLVVGGGVGYSGYKLTSGASLERVEASRGDLSTAGSGFAQGADVSTPKGAITYLPVGLANFMLGPFPWQAHGVRQLISLPDVLIWWALLPSLWKGMRQAVRQRPRQSLLLILPAGILAAALSLLVGNFGTAVRERLQVLIVLMPFIALGLTLKRSTAPTDATTQADAAGGDVLVSTHLLSSHSGAS